MTPPTGAHPPNDTSSPSPVPSLNDLLGLADDARALDKLGGDYGLDTGTKRADTSTTNAMRFLRELKHTFPEILRQNEPLIIATGNEEDLRGRRLHPQKDVSWTWSHPPARNLNLHLRSHQHCSASQEQHTFASYDHSKSKSNSQISPSEPLGEEFGNSMAQSGPVVPSLPATNTNVRAAAVTPGTYYGGLASSLSPISLSSAPSNSLPVRSSSSNNSANSSYFRSSVEDPSGVQYARTRDRQHISEPEEQQKNDFGKGNPRRHGYGTAGSPKQLSSPTVSNSSTTSSTSPPSMSSQSGSTFASGESSNSPHYEYPVTAPSQSPVLMTRMHPHTLTHNHPVTSPSTFVPVPEPTACYENENEIVRGYGGSHQYGPNEYEYHRYVSGGGLVYVQQPLPWPLASPTENPIQYSVPGAHAHIHDSLPSGFPPTATSDWVPLPAQTAYAQQQDIMTLAPSEWAADPTYAYSYHDDRAHAQW